MLKGSVAIITGGSRGIGSGIARELASRGADIVINYRSSAKEAEALRNELLEFGVRVLLVQADISSSLDVKRLLDETVAHFGKIDILVNNAGITKDGLLMRMSDDDFDKVLDTNLKGAFYTIRAVSSLFIKQKHGRIINITSVIGISGNAGQANYASSKAGLIGLTKSAAKELGGKGITVNAIAPGFIQTEMTDILSDKIKEGLLERISLKRFGIVQDVAKLTAFLASEDAAYITGQVISVDGGLAL